MTPDIKVTLKQCQTKNTEQLLSKVARALTDTDNTIIIIVKTSNCKSTKLVYLLTCSLCNDMEPL